MYRDLVHTETDAKGVTYQLYIEQDEIEVRGNALASGDDAADKACEDEILERLENGDVWAWAQTICRASFKGSCGFDYLGACSYRDTAEFIQSGGYWDDMKNEARKNMLSVMRAECEALQELEMGS